METASLLRCAAGFAPYKQALPHRFFELFELQTFFLILYASSGKHTFTISFFRLTTSGTNKFLSCKRFMIFHALNIVIKELDRHLSDNYEKKDSVKLGNLAEGFPSGGNNSREMLYMSVVNIQEEKTLKNSLYRAVDNVSLKAIYENPPVFINLFILITAAHSYYEDALLMLSRTIRFFQSQNFFTQENVDPDSIISTNALIRDIEKIESFKLIFDLYSPTLEEVNHLWGTLGGKQYPFVLYKVRMLDLQFKAVQKKGELITEVISNFSHKEKLTTPPQGAGY